MRLLAIFLESPACIISTNPFCFILGKDFSKPKFITKVFLDKSSIAECLSVVYIYGFCSYMIFHT